MFLYKNNKFFKRQGLTGSSYEEKRLVPASLKCVDLRTTGFRIKLLNYADFLHSFTLPFFIELLSRIKHGHLATSNDQITRKHQYAADIRVIYKRLSVSKVETGILLV